MKMAVQEGGTEQGRNIKLVRLCSGGNHATDHATDHAKATHKAAVAPLPSSRQST